MKALENGALAVLNNERSKAQNNSDTTSFALEIRATVSVWWMSQWRWLTWKWQIVNILSTYSDILSLSELTYEIVEEISSLDSFRNEILT